MHQTSHIFKARASVGRSGARSVAPPESGSLPWNPAGLRLLIVADSSSTHTHRWAQWFQRRGADVTVISPFADLIDNVQVVPFPPRRRWYHAVPKMRVLLDYLPFRRLIRRIDPQLIHFHFVSEGGRQFYWHGLDVPMVASTWGQDAIFDAGPQPRAQRSLRRMLARCAAITATSHQLAAATAQYAGPDRPIHVIPFGIDLSQFTARPPAQRDEVVFGFVKHLLPKYGPDVMIDAFALAHAARPKSRLVICGRGWMRSELRRRVVNLGLERHVEFLGRVPHEQVPQLMRGFDAMLMPSVYESETFGVAALEAAATGIPVIASRVGGVCETVLDGRTGVLVPPRDVKALADACIDLIDDPALRTRLGDAGRRFVQRHYVWQDNAMRMEEIYRCVLHNEHPHSVPAYAPGFTPDFATD